MASSPSKSTPVNKKELKKVVCKKLPSIPPLYNNIHNPKRAQTLCSYYFNGNITIPEICVDSITQQCPKEKEGCSRLHANQPWHWQLKHKSEWYNFIHTQSDVLERAFQKVDVVEVVIPPLNPTKTGKIGLGLLQLLGTDAWKADFIDMNITRVGFDDSIQIRRLSTPSSAKFKHKWSTEYSWYFQRDDSWISFDNCVTRTEDQVTTCSLASSQAPSNDIESNYKKDPKGSISVYVLNDECYLNFEDMKLINKETCRVMAVRRRPQDCNVMFPAIWSRLIHDADIAEICKDKVDKTNDFWEWQVLHSEIWYKMPKVQARVLEQGYLQIWLDGIDIPAIKPEKMGRMGEVMSPVLGINKLHAKFDSKVLTQLKHQGMELTIRRLSWPSGISVDKKLSAEFVWFYENKDNVWVEFGCVEDMNEGRMKLPQTLSCDIEEAYVSGKQDTMDVTVSDTLYILNFSFLTLCNYNTNEIIPIRRRPYYADSNNIYGRSLNIIPLSSSSREYDTVKKTLSLNAEEPKSLNIKRLQNPALRKVFRKRQNETSKLQGRKKTVDVLTLFHWVKKGTVEDIHAKNFGQRHLCPEIKKICDKREVCFFKSTEFLHKSCSSSPKIHRLMVFEVIVVKEKVTVEKTSDGDHKTRVDDITVPTVFFKTDKRDYCPSYILEF